MCPSAAIEQNCLRALLSSVRSAQPAMSNTQFCTCPSFGTTCLSSTYCLATEAAPFSLEARLTRRSFLVLTLHSLLCFSPLLAHHDPSALDVNWPMLLIVCVPGIAGMLWFSWRLHQSINRCKVPEDHLMPNARSRASKMDDKYD